MDGRKMNHKSSPLVNGHARDISSQNQTNYQGVTHLSASSLGTRAMMSIAEGVRNGTKNTKGSISEDSDPKSQGNPAKNKAFKSPNNIDGPPGSNREHDHYLPIANVVRIMRRTLPAHAKVADEAKEMIQECVSEFISFCTSEANDTCQKEHRKTITAEDLIGAMSRLGFDHYVEPLLIYLQKYRENEILPFISRSNVLQGSNMHPNDSLPPFGVPTLIHPQYAMYRSAGNGVYYHDGPGPRSGTGNVGQDFSAASVNGGNEPSLGIKGGQSSDERAGSSGSPQAKMGFYDPYGQ